jgi:hypothetical protein
LKKKGDFDFAGISYSIFIGMWQAIDMFSENIQRVLELQGSYSPNNTPEMQERGFLIRNDLRESIVSILSKSGSDKWEVEGSDGKGNKQVFLGSVSLGESSHPVFERDLTSYSFLQLTVQVSICR